MNASAFSALPITVAIHGTLLLFNSIRATGTPVKNCAEINMTAALRSWTFVFSSGGCRGADMVNNYNLQEEVERCRHFKEGVSLVHERAGPRRVLFPSNAAGAPQAYQHGVLSILSILWVGRLPVPTPSFHYSRLRMCVCWWEGRVGRQGKKKNVAEWQREKTITNRMSPRKWSLVNKGEMELIFQTCIQVPFGVGKSGGGGAG